MLVNDNISTFVLPVIVTKTIIYKPIKSNTMEVLSDSSNKLSVIVDSFMTKICVSKPYFALTDFCLYENEILEASFTMENHHYLENFTISSGESGRHLAILGLCALSLKNPFDEKYYYLATHATGGNFNINMLNNKNKNIEQKRFKAQAKVILLDVAKKKGQVETMLFNEYNEAVAWLHVSYKVFRYDLFGKLYGKFYLANSHSFVLNPYKNPVEILDLHVVGDQLHGKTGTIKPEQCAGHFDHFPALPVAVLCSALFEIAGKHFCYVLSDDSAKFAVKRIELSANRLAFAGEFLILQSEIKEGHVSKGFIVRASDYEGQTVARLDVVFESNG